MLLLNRDLLDLSKGFRRWILLIAVLKMLTLVGVAQFANSISWVLGSLYTHNLHSLEMKEQLMTSFIASLLVLLGNILVGEAEHYCTARARISLRQQIFTKVLELDVRDVDAIGPSNTINAAIDGIETMQSYYNRYLPGLLYCIFAPIYLFYILKSKCLAAAVALLVFAIVIMPANSTLSEMIYKLKKDYWDALSDLTSYYLESINSLTTTELFNRGPDREAGLKGRCRHLVNTVLGIMKINFTTVTMNEFFINVGIFVATAIVCIKTATGNLDLVVALTVLFLSYNYFSSVRELHWIAHSALMGIAAAQNIIRILDIDTSIKVLKKDQVDSPEGIRIEDMTFAYKGREDVLKGINLEINRGQTVALVGESGCGKSTIVSMLLRFYDAKEGSIRLDGRNYLSMDPKELRRRIIMVPQHVYIFSGTLRDNLRLANDQATDDELIEALDHVRLLEWAESLPEGLDTYLGDAGSILSGGQRQKIGIARALLTHAEYIIFDEATSSVDEQSEREIWNCIHDLGKTRTLIIISHRLSTIRHAEKIYVLEEGTVCESGTHEELLANHGLYARLVEQQDVLELMGERSLSL